MSRKVEGEKFWDGEEERETQLRLWPSLARVRDYTFTHQTIPALMHTLWLWGGQTKALQQLVSPS